MAKTLILARHAKATPYGSVAKDFDRALQAEGKACAAMMSKEIINAINTSSDVASQVTQQPLQVICSAAKRTQQTWHIMADKLVPYFSNADKNTVDIEFTEAIYEVSPGDILNVLQKTDDQYASIMTVGHNPGTEALAAHFAGRGNIPGFPTSSVAIIHLPDLSQWADLGSNHSNQLVGFLRPADFDWEW